MAQCALLDGTSISTLSITETSLRFYSERLFNVGALDQEVASHSKYKYKYEIVGALDWVPWYSKYKYKYKTVDALD